MKNTAPLFLFATLGVCLNLACNSTGEPGCASDNDCKGERICEERQCVDPLPATEASSALPVQTTAAPAPEKALPVLPAPALGANLPLVVITEMGDFQCQLCAAATKVVRRLLEQFNKDKKDAPLRFEWRHNPLEKHVNAELLARAAIAAQMQGRFWQFHDRVFANQKGLTVQSIEGHAKAVGLDPIKWNSDRQHSNLKAAVALARQRALALGASGTPSFFVNGRLLGGLQSAQRIKRVIEAEISKAQKLLADGVPRKQIVQKLTRLNNANFARLFFDGQAPRAATAGQAKVSQTVWKIPVRDHNPQRGPKDALVTLVEFADFECPYCAKQHVVLSRLLTRFPRSLRIVFKNSPQSFHKNALAAAHAGAYAQSRGRFWAFAERVFAHQGKLDNQALVQHAQAIGLDGKQAEGAINRQAFAKEILGDQADAASVAAVGTPNLFINGRKVVGYRNADILAALISEEAGKAKSMIEEGTAARELYNTIIARGKERQPLSQKRGSFSAFGRPTKGPENAPIQLTVFADFQCPFSRNLVPILARVNQAFDGKVHTLFKHFPQGFHKSARSAARVAVCAHEQERFWDLHNALFDAQRQRHMDAGNLRTYALEVGLNTKKLNACLGSKRPDSILEQDLAEAKTAGVKGTPSIFLNGRLFNSPTGYNDRSLTRVFSQILNAAGN